MRGYSGEKTEAGVNKAPAFPLQRCWARAGLTEPLEEDMGSQLGLEGLCPGQEAGGAEGGRSNTAKSGNLKVDRQRDKGMASGLVWDRRASPETPVLAEKAM